MVQQRSKDALYFVVFYENVQVNCRWRWCESKLRFHHHEVEHVRAFYMLNKVHCPSMTHMSSIFHFLRRSHPARNSAVSSRQWRKPRTPLGADTITKFSLVDFSTTFSLVCESSTPKLLLNPTCASASSHLPTYSCSHCARVFRQKRLCL